MFLSFSLPVSKSNETMSSGKNTILKNDCPNKMPVCKWPNLKCIHLDSVGAGHVNGVCFM